MSRKQVLSCIQPTGDMHLGNYFGAVRNYVNLQQEYDCNYGVVDYHAITMPYDIKKLRANVWDLAFNLIAVGVEPSNLFVQSLVPEHAELGWIFNCFCSVGRLTNMTQYKDKSQKSEASSNESFISAGLLDYPVLQAADILIYKADFVPVGKDQAQHLELSREIAQRFNHFVGKEYFVMPETLYTETPNIRSTADPARKMSKSAGEKHYISLFSDEARVRKQIRSAVTDTGEETGDGMSPGVANLFEIIKASAGANASLQKESTFDEVMSSLDTSSDYDRLMSDYNEGSLKYSELKQVVADSVVAMLMPFQEKKKEILADKRNYKDQIKQSSIEIRKQAKETVKEVKDLIGLLNVKD